MDNHREAIERFCHVIGKNTPVFKSDVNGEAVFECMNRHICEKNGGCKNAKFCNPGTDKNIQK